MTTVSQNRARFVAVASVFILTSVFSLKGVSGTLSMFKVEELAVLQNRNHAKSRMHKPEERAAGNKRADFVICNNCFWCASQIKAGDFFGRCPSCGKFQLEKMPVSLNEAYFFHRAETGGVNLAFRKDGDRQSFPNSRSLQ